MKTKLLRKVRKEWVIEYNPEGILAPGVFGEIERYPYKFMVVNTSNTYKNRIFETKNECIDYIMRYVRRDYPHKSRRIKGPRNQKIWYND